MAIYTPLNSDTNQIELHTECNRAQWNTWNKYIFCLIVCNSSQMYLSQYMPIHNVDIIVF